MQIVQASSQQLKLSMVEKEALLPRLVEEHWLAPSPHRMGYYSIGVRFRCQTIIHPLVPVRSRSFALVLLY